MTLFPGSRLSRQQKKFRTASNFHANSDALQSSNIIVGNQGPAIRGKA
jgi:hypothetical protein